MGNRAFVIFTDGEDISPAVYLHWNGGPESVYAFLAEFERREIRKDPWYAPARFCQIVGEHFDQKYRSGLSLGVMNGPDTISVTGLKSFDHGDNGVYVVSWRDDRVRRFVSGYESGLRELSAEDADKEREEAMLHPYNVGKDSIASFFDDGKPLESERVSMFASTG